MSKFSKHIVKGRWQVSIPLLAISGLLYTIAVSMFLYKAKAFPTGTGAYAQLIVYALDFEPQYFSMFLVAFNLIFFLLFWKVIEKKFMVYTLIWTMCQLGWAQMFYLDVFQNKNPFDVSMIDSENFTSAGRLIYALAGAMLSGLSIGLAFIAGGSTAGTDLLVYYLYKKHKKSIGLFEIGVGISTAFSAVIIQYALGQSSETSIFKLFFGMTTFITIIYISITGVIMNIIYPRHKKVRLHISSNKINEISNYLLESQFHHAHAIKKEHSGYSKKHNQIITTVIFYLEADLLVTNIRKIDSNVWISMTYVAKIFGNFEDRLLE